MGVEVFNSFFKDKLNINNHVILKSRRQNVPRVSRYRMQHRCKICTEIALLAWAAVTELWWRVPWGYFTRDWAEERARGSFARLSSVRNQCIYCCAIVVRLDYPGFLCFMLWCCNFLLLYLIQNLCSCLRWTEPVVFKVLASMLQSLSWWK